MAESKSGLLTRIQRGWRRTNVTLVVLALLFISAALRLVFLQVVKGPELAEAARNNRIATFTIEAPRGSIVDAEGNELATSTQVVHVGVNQLLIREYVHRDKKDPEKILGVGPAEAAKQLAPLLKQDPAELGGKMIGTLTYEPIAKNLTPQQWREIAKLGIRGIEPDFRSRRVYPNGNVAGNLVGFVNELGDPMAGLEATYDETLTGTPGEERVEVGGDGPRIPTGFHQKIPAIAGSTVHLTILRELQDVAQRAVQDAKETYGAAWAAAAVQDVQTGKLLAIADSDTVNPNEYWKSSKANWGARSINSVYEPGSTGKLLTFAAAIDQGTVSPTTVFTVPHKWTTPDGEVIDDFTDHATERRTVAGILKMSYNTGTVMVGQTLKPEVRYDYFKRFHIGDLIDVGMPAQSAGILAPWQEWEKRQNYTTMFGQAYAVTLLQNVGVVATIANSGVYLAPQLIAGVTDANGVYHASETGKPERVLKDDSAKIMLKMMEGVTQEGGTGVRAAIDGYRVAAKTGTAQVADATGALTQTAGVFNAIIPADNPRLAVSVVVYHPQSGFQGGIVAAPVFKEIATFALRYLGIPPSETPPELYPVLEDEEETTGDS